MSQSSETEADVVDVQGIPISYEMRGAGVPIVLVHGWSADRNYMKADLEPIFAANPGWQRIYLDLPGHGATPAPAWLSTQDQMLSIVESFIDAVVPDRPFAIAGSSYGGYIALAVTRSIPDRLCGAALLIPDVPAPDGTRDLDDAIVLIENRSIFDDLAPDEEWIPGGLVVHERRMLDEIRAHDMPGYRAADYEFLARLEANYLLDGAAARPGPPFARPSLILTGRQDSRVGYRGAWELVEELPRATYAVLDLAGHHLGRIERPGLFRALVGDWLERMEATEATAAR